MKRGFLFVAAVALSAAVLSSCRHRTLHVKNEVMVREDVITIQTQTALETRSFMGGVTEIQIYAFNADNGMYQFNNVFSRGSGNLYYSNPEYYWEDMDASRMYFEAWSPVRLQYADHVLSFTSDSDISRHKDLLVGNARSSRSDGPVVMSLENVLSRIYVRVQNLYTDKQISIRGLRFHNFIASDRYRFDKGASDGAAGGWLSPSNAAHDAVLTAELGEAITTGPEVTYIIGGDSECCGARVVPQCLDVWDPAVDPFNSGSGACMSILMGVSTNGSAAEYYWRTIQLGSAAFHQGRTGVYTIVFGADGSTNVPDLEDIEYDIDFEEVGEGEEPEGRVVYTVEHWQQNTDDDDYTKVEDDTESKSGAAGETTAAAARTYTGFTAQEVTQAGIMADGSTVVKIYYNRNIINLTFDLDGGSTTTTLSDDGELSGRYGADVVIEEPTRDDYAFTGWVDSDDQPVNLPATFPEADAAYKATWSQSVAGYTVEHWQQNTDDDEYTKVEDDTESKNGTIGGNTAAIAKTYTGFTAQEVTQATVAADGSTVVKIYYDRNIINLTFDLDGGSTTTTLTDGKLSGRYGAAVSIAKPTRENCDFVSWDSPVPDTFTEAGSYKAQWDGHTRTRDEFPTNTETEYTFNVTPSANLKVEYSGGDISYAVTSYSTTTTYKTATHYPEKYNPATDEWEANGTATTDEPVQDGEPEVRPEPWKVSSNSASWLTNLPMTETTPSSSSAQSKTANANASSYSEGSGVEGSEEMNTYMKTIAPSVSGYDLSKHDIYGGAISQTTANCYIVSAPGTYKFPVVYGNALSGGGDNSAAYTASYTPLFSSYLSLPSFVDHDGASITSPNSGLGSASSAELIWNDMSDGAISVNSSLTTEGGYKYVTFKVTSANIKQGNALIAVKDDNSIILWSWHIWFTVPGKSIDVASGVEGSTKTYGMFPCNLGWCDDNATVEYSTKKKIYAERNASVVFTQVNNTGADKDINRIFTQTSYEEYANGSGNGVKSVAYSNKGNGSTYYQWGRKDPFIGAAAVGSATDKTCYGTNYSYEDNSSATVAMNIQNPTVFYHCSFNPNTTSDAFNVWNANNNACWSENSWTDKNGETDDSVVKTVYDPCPIGFSVAPANAFTVFTSTGKNSYGTAKRSEWNVEGSYSKGWVFYSQKDKTGTEMYFPETNNRSPSSSAGYQGKIDSGSYAGYSWSAVPNTNTTGRYLSFGSNYVTVVGYNSRAVGLPVRPVAEQ